MMLMQAGRYDERSSGDEERQECGRLR